LESVADFVGIHSSSIALIVTVDLKQDKKPE
jgi:hypothetical protein